MTWFGLVFIGLEAFSMILSVALIGQPRKPRTPAKAIVEICTAGALIAGILFVGTGSIN